jgi:hypothetical protein
MLGFPATTFIVPRKRYLYTTPYGRRQQKSSKYTSPFPTFWYYWPGKISIKVNTGNSALASNDRVVYCKQSQFLPPEAMSDNDPNKKRYKNAMKMSGLRNTDTVNSTM